MSRTIRVLLADDHAYIRAGLRATLATEPDISIVGEATNGYQVRRLCDELRPDVLILDLSMPGLLPREMVTYLHSHYPDIRVLMLTIYDDDAYVRDMVAAGAAGYVLKEEATAALVRAIRTVAQGDTWFSRAVVEKLVRRHEESASASEKEYHLSERDQRLLDLIARGLDNSQIASELALAQQTVRNYVSRLYTRIGVRTRAEAVVWARRRGLAGDG